LNLADYTKLINKPDAINDIHSISLEKIVQEFPYFQSAKALFLKGLYNQNSFKYNSTLKITAAHTADRSVLFEFISSDTFNSVEKELFEKKAKEVLEIKLSEIEILSKEEPKLEPKSYTIEDSILNSIKKSLSIQVHEIEIVEGTLKVELPQLETKTDIVFDKLELGKPLEFSKNEKHSFQQWLQISKIQSIDRTEKSLDAYKINEIESDKQKKNNLIDQFIEKSPKIQPLKADAAFSGIVFEPSKADNSYLMTETLARVYLEQKKYQKAIQAYEILILKYPEKSSFFADRILDIKNLQQNNK